MRPADGRSLPAISAAYVLVKFAENASRASRTSHANRTDARAALFRPARFRSSGKYIRIRAEIFVHRVCEALGDGRAENRAAGCSRPNIIKYVCVRRTLAPRFVFGRSDVVGPNQSGRGRPAVATEQELLNCRLEQ